VSNLKKLSTEEPKQCQDVNNVPFNGEDCDVDCYALFKELHMFAAVIQLNVSNIKELHMFAAVIQLNVSNIKRHIPVYNLEKSG
jgi:hypothetical protein